MTMHTLYTPKEGAHYCGYSHSRFEQLRAEGRGPKFYKVGNAKNALIVYTRGALDDWLRSRSERVRKRAAKNHASADVVDVFVEAKFRRRIVEILTGAFHVTMPDFEAFMRAQGYKRLTEIPSEKRDGFLTALVEHCLTTEDGEAE